MHLRRAAPNFTASTLLDPTTIEAELVIDWSGGTAAPFSSFDSSSIVLDPATSNFGLRHQIQIGSQIDQPGGTRIQPVDYAGNELGRGIFDRTRSLLDGGEFRHLPCVHHAAANGAKRHHAGDGDDRNRAIYGLDLCFFRDEHYDLLE